MHEADNGAVDPNSANVGNVAMRISVLNLGFSTPVRVWHRGICNGFGRTART
jgi:hypothetical protein